MSLKFLRIGQIDLVRIRWDTKKNNKEQRNTNMHAIYQKQSEVAKQNILKTPRGGKDSDNASSANASNANGSPAKIISSAVTTNLKNVEHQIGSELRFCNSSYNGILFELNNKQQTGMCLRSIKFRSGIKDCKDGRLYIRAGFHANEKSIEIEAFEPIAITESFMHVDSRSSGGSYGVRTLTITAAGGYYMEAGETYTIMLHSPSNEFFVYYQTADSDELANELFYENTYYGLNTGFYVNDEFESGHGVRKFSGSLTFGVAKN